MHLRRDCMFGVSCSSFVSDEPRCSFYAVKRMLSRCKFSPCNFSTAKAAFISTNASIRLRICCSETLSGFGWTGKTLAGTWRKGIFDGTGLGSRDAAFHGLGEMTTSLNQRPKYGPKSSGEVAAVIVGRKSEDCSDACVATRLCVHHES